MSHTLPSPLAVEQEPEEKHLCKEHLLQKPAAQGQARSRALAGGGHWHTALRCTGSPPVSLHLPTLATGARCLSHPGPQNRYTQASQRAARFYCLLLLEQGSSATSHPGPLAHTAGRDCRKQLVSAAAPIHNPAPTRPSGSCCSAEAVAEGRWAALCSPMSANLPGAPW